jgi:hypothetical protein
MIRREPTASSSATFQPRLDGTEFSPLLALKALAYHEDDALARLSRDMRQDLIAAVGAVDLHDLPPLTAVRKRPQ